MLASIHPLGERARHSSWAVTVTAFAVGAAAGGMLAGSAAGSLGWAVALALPWGTAATAGVAVALGVAGAAFDLVPGLRLPSPHRQVNEDWLTRYRGWVYGLGFGFQLGLGVATIVTSALVYVVLGLAFLSASPAVGAVVGLAFGLTRGLTVLVPSRVRDHRDLRALHRRVAGWAPGARRTAGTAMVALAAVAAVAAV